MAEERRFVIHAKRSESISRTRKKRELYRLALAALDIRTAENYCAELFESIDWSSGKGIPFHLTDAFSAAVVVAYARPFVPTRDPRSVGVLPPKWHRFSNPRLKETHDAMLRLRNDLFAHTDQTMSPMTIIPAGTPLMKVGRIAPRTSWQIGRRAIPPQTTILNYRQTCYDLRKRLEDAVSKAIEELYDGMDLPRASFNLRFDDGL
jgi:hypothetical protein